MMIHETTDLLEKHKKRLSYLITVKILLFIWLIFAALIGYTYYYTMTSDMGPYVPSEKIYLFFIIFFLLTPIIYKILHSLWLKSLTIIYQPIEESVKNNENFNLNINHEFKTPITELISTLSIADEVGNHKEACKISLKSARQMNTILDGLSSMIQLVDYSYREEYFDMGDVSNEIIETYKCKIKEKNLHVQLKSQVNHRLIRLDKKHYYICFSNILSNAIRYSREGGIIEINLLKNGFSIRDFGIGIDEKNSENIFKNYFRESYVKEGQGIGLSMVKKITDMHNWTIKIESKKGEFTLITILF